MEWRRPPTELVERLQELVPDDPAIEFKPMFGGPCYWTRGNLFAAVHQESVVVRLGDVERRALLELPGACPFAPMGRRMKEYGVLPPDVVADDARGREWVAKAFAYASSLPPKEKKARRRRDVSAGG
jgi:TfoX/Sxy family transcriptional regulator of competence genes